MILQIHLLAPTERESCARLLEMIQPKNGAVIADMGSGLGAVAEHMTALRPDLRFFCVNKDVEQLVNNKVGHLIHSDYHKTIIPDESCDVVMFNYSIGYADLDVAFAEAKRILRPSGAMFIWDFVGNAPLMKKHLNYNTHSVADFKNCARGFELEWVKYPETFTENCRRTLSEKDRELLDETSKEVKPAAFLFTKVKLGLAFSGGKDSWACLLLHRHRLPEITVFWVNTGKNFPELLATIEAAKAMCPNFVEVVSNREAQNDAMGLPSDIVPINWTKAGMAVTSGKATMVQSYLDCCFVNIAYPLHEAVREHGITHLITGQRTEEGHKATIKDGDVLLGVKRIHPIEGWTTKQVMDFLSTAMVMPEHLSLHHSSMDCYDCTAYRAETADRVEYSKRHPALFEAYTERNNRLNAALKEAQYGMA